MSNDMEGQFQISFKPGVGGHSEPNSDFSGDRK